MVELVFVRRFPLFELRGFLTAPELFERWLRDQDLYDLVEDDSGQEVEARDGSSEELKSQKDRYVEVDPELDLPRLATRPERSDILLEQLPSSVQKGHVHLVAKIVECRTIPALKLPNKKLSFSFLLRTLNLQEVR